MSASRTRPNPRADDPDLVIERHAWRLGADENGIHWARHQYNVGIRRGLHPAEATLRALGELDLWVDQFERIDRTVAAACMGADKFVRDAGMEAQA